MKDFVFVVWLLTFQTLQFQSVDLQMENYIGRIAMKPIVRQSQTQMRKREEDSQHLLSAPTRQATDSQTGKKQIKFLRDIYTSPQKTTRWNQVSMKDQHLPTRRKIPTLIDLQQDLHLYSEEHKETNKQKPFEIEVDNQPQSSARTFRFEKKQLYNEIHKDLLAKSSTNFLRTFQRPLTPRDSSLKRKGKLGCMTESNQKILPPPLGYYHVENANDFKKKQPMLVFMSSKDRSFSQPQHVHSQSVPQLELIDKESSQRSKKQRDQREIIEMISSLQRVGEDQLKRRHQLENIAMKEKTKYIPKSTDYDPTCFITFTQNIDDMKKKLRSMRQELNTWTDRQVKIFKQSV